MEQQFIYSINLGNETTEYKEELEKIENFASKNGYKRVIFDAKKIIFINKNGINKDHRGSNHCEIFLHFHESFTVTAPISLEDFYLALIKTKSHKFENWYELFMKSTVQKLEESSYSINFKHDHGS